MSADASARRPGDEASPGERGTSPGAHARVTTLVELERDECLRLLSKSRLGRLAVGLADGSPLVRPVNYVFDERSQSVAFRTGAGTKLHALLGAKRATFEVDEIDPAGRSGWSVIVSGMVEEVTGLTERERLDELALDVWAPGERNHWCRIRAWTVSGRRISPAT